MFEGTNENAGRLGAVLDTVLEWIIEAYIELTAEPPERQYIAHGKPAVDCEQLVVYVSRLYAGLPAAEQPGIICEPIRVIEVAIEAHRCYPVLDGGGNPPDADTLTAASLALASDSWVIRRAAEQFTMLGVANKGIGALQPIEPEGGFAGCTQLIGLSLV